MNKCITPENLLLSKKPLSLSTERNGKSNGSKEEFSPQVFPARGESCRFAAQLLPLAGIFVLVCPSIKPIAARSENESGVVQSKVIVGKISSASDRLTTGDLQSSQQKTDKTNQIFTGNGSASLAQAEKNALKILCLISLALIQ